MQRRTTVFTLTKHCCVHVMFVLLLLTATMFSVLAIPFACPLLQLQLLLLLLHLQLLLSERYSAMHAAISYWDVVLLCIMAYLKAESTLVVGLQIVIHLNA